MSKDRASLSPENATILAKIEAKCIEDGGCLIWTGGFTSSGYPRMTVGGKVTTVRRHLAAMKIGRPVGHDEFAGCTCGDPKCLEWDHIRVIKVSTARCEAWAKGRYSQPTRSAAISRKRRETAKLDEGKAAMARNDPRPSHLVAADLGCSPSMVRKIRRNAAWKPLQANPFTGLMR